MDSDMAHSSRSGPDITTAPVAAQATQISTALAAIWHSDTNMVSGGCLDSRNPLSL